MQSTADTMLATRLGKAVKMGELVGKRSLTCSCINRNKDWLSTQKTAARQESDRRHQLMVAARQRTQAAEDADMAREEAARAELLARQAEMPPDAIGPDYFKDKTRFNIAEDPRDPIYRDVKNNSNESTDWRSIVDEGVQKGRETMRDIRNSNPFEAYQMEVREGEIGYTVIKFARRTIFFLAATVFVLGFMEMKWHYDHDIDVYAMEKEVYERHHTIKYDDEK